MSTTQSRRCVRVAVAVVLAGSMVASATQAQNFWNPGPPRDNDPVVFTFATVGDSRTETAAPDPTTLLEAGEPGTFSSGTKLGTPSEAGKPDLTGTLLQQDSTFLTNTKALSRILRGIQREKPNLLFFNGDMIYGYGRPSVPPQLATITSVQGTTSTALAWTDAVFEYRQYAYWRGIMGPLFETGTYVVPVPGNHETQCSVSAAHDPDNCGASGKHAYPENEAAFKDNVGDLIEDIYTNERFQTVSGFAAIANNGFSATTAPQAGGNNGALTGVVTATNPTGEAELSYSFDVKTSANQMLHFVVINTDPAGADATAPTDWLAQDLEDAQNRAAANHLTAKLFVFGHKPAFTYGYNVVTAAPATVYTPYGANGLDALTGLNSTTAATSVSVKDATGKTVTIATNVPQIIVDTKPQKVTAETYKGATAYPLTNLFWAVIAHYNATYFSGHEHLPHVEQFKDVTGGSKNTPYQVIVGSGGSPFDVSMTSDSPPREPVPLLNWQDRYYAWATVQVHRSGAVSLVVQGFGDGARYDPSTGVVNALGVETPAQVLWAIPQLQ